MSYRKWTIFLLLVPKIVLAQTNQMRFIKSPETVFMYGQDPKNRYIFSQDAFIFEKSPPIDTGLKPQAGNLECVQASLKTLPIANRYFDLTVDDFKLIEKITPNIHAILISKYAVAQTVLLPSQDEFHLLLSLKAMLAKNCPDVLYSKGNYVLADKNFVHYLLIKTKSSPKKSVPIEEKNIFLEQK